MVVKALPHRINRVLGALPGMAERGQRLLQIGRKRRGRRDQVRELVDDHCGGPFLAQAEELAEGLAEPGEGNRLAKSSVRCVGRSEIGQVLRLGLLRCPEHEPASFQGQQLKQQRLPLPPTPVDKSERRPELDPS